MSGVRAIVAALSSFWSRGQPVERSGYAIGALLISSGLIHLAILIITGASWDCPLHRPCEPPRKLSLQEPEEAAQTGVVIGRYALAGEDEAREAVGLMRLHALGS
jgi:hypothetical protein